MQDGPSTFEAERERLVEDLTAVEHLLDKYSDVLDDHPEATREIRQLAQAVPGESSALLKEGRLLRLGIVGQIKAGKSTLLNLLLFDGREVLPKAATPMTAALTHIVRSDELGAGHAEIEVDYYSPDEWQEIEQGADEYRKAKRAGRNPKGWLQACHELVEMAARRRGSFMDMDHTAPDIRSVTVDNLNEELHRLVGAEGDRTPWVKSVTIRCGGEGVPDDFNIVDTPGLNDPVISRVRKTRKLLAKCDAVLLLSYAGQFMDSSDIQLLTETLPDEGIRRRVVIGSKFDSALVDEARTYRGDLQEAADDIEKKLREQATKSERPDDDVVFVSAMCAVLGAKRDAAEWSTVEREAFDNLCREYPDWFDSPDGGLMNEDTARNLVELVGRREHIDQCISEIRNHKAGITRDKVRYYLPQKRKAAKDRIFALIDALKENQDEVGTAEIVQLKDRMLVAREAIEGNRDKVIDTWLMSLDAQRKGGIDGTRKSFSNEISEARQNIENSVTTESHRIKKPAGILSFLGRLLSGEDHYEQYEEKVLNANSLKLALDEGYDKIRNIVHEQLRKMFDYGFVRTVQKEMRRALADSLDNEIAAIVGRSLGSSLNRAVETIAARARDKIAEHTAGSAPERFDVPERGTDSSKQSKSIEYVNELSNYCDMVLKDAEGTMDKTIENAESDLIPVAVQRIQEHYARLERDLKEREVKLQRYQQAIDELGRCGQRLAS